ncbi:hypothetical protein PITCH_A400053 [uncultured Desulfobacterium sp.]|uniref:Ice-binding protein C-terminal domain-containing protein n=1 Tax=uncultured Desulfobacterium sp. TaxID=201089 RepID=A0A445MZU5_9BACT|nr:hypothetical protein PITCH_A400053 [uncultured Desulfobacterium sp.]
MPVPFLIFFANERTGGWRKFGEATIGSSLQTSSQVDYHNNRIIRLSLFSLPNWSASSLLGTWSDNDGSGTKNDVVFTTYLTNGNYFSIGIDPDCHFYGTKITVDASTAPVPEPATILLIGSGLIGLARFRKKAQKA